MSLEISVLEFVPHRVRCQWTIVFVARAEDFGRYIEANGKDMVKFFLDLKRVESSVMPSRDDSQGASWHV